MLIYLNGMAFIRCSKSPYTCTCEPRPCLHLRYTYRDRKQVQRNAKPKYNSRNVPILTHMKAMKKRQSTRVVSVTPLLKVHREAVWSPDAVFLTLNKRRLIRSDNILTHLSSGASPPGFRSCIASVTPNFRSVTGVAFNGANRSELSFHALFAE